MGAEQVEVLFSCDKFRPEFFYKLIYELSYCNFPETKLDFLCFSH